MNNPAYLKRIDFRTSDVVPCDICKREPGAYHVVRDRIDGGGVWFGYLYRRRKEGLANAWCICNSDICFNMALMSDLSEWYE